MTTSEMLEKVLSDLGRVGEIEACAIATRDGLLMQANMPAKGDPETFVAMSATMLGAAETASSELGKGVPKRVIVEADDGKLICMGAGPKALVVAMTAPEVGLGLVLVELSKSAEKVEKLL